MNMIATVIQVNSTSLLVRDDSNGQEVLVHYRYANRFKAGDYISIIYNGVMTSSIPPQITASSIDKVSLPNPEPTELRGTVIQTGRDALVVRGSNGQQYRVTYPYSYHFCRNQRVRVQYEAQTNSTQISATDILPIC